MSSPREELEREGREAEPVADIADARKERQPSVGALALGGVVFGGAARAAHPATVVANTTIAPSLTIPRRAPTLAQA